jgi:hypothetical protein
MSNKKTEEDLLVTLSKGLTKYYLQILEGGEASPSDIRNILTHLKQNDISVDMMDTPEVSKTIELLKGIPVEDVRNPKYLKKA